MSTSIIRTIKNIYHSGLRRAAWQIQSHNDTKRGWFVGEDDFKNKYYETDVPGEIHLRTRWVEYSNWNVDISQVEPGWHFWLAYGANTPPNKLPDFRKTHSRVPAAPRKPNLTATRGAFVTYNTAKPKHFSWQPQVRERAGI